MANYEKLANSQRVGEYPSELKFARHHIDLNLALASFSFWLLLVLRGAFLSL